MATVWQNPIFTDPMAGEQDMMEAIRVQNQTSEDSLSVDDIIVNDAEIVSLFGDMGTATTQFFLYALLLTKWTQQI